MPKFLIILLSVLAIAAFGQNPKKAGPEVENPTIRVGAEEVVLDVVARDKKGQPVTDLTPADLEVYDNGVRRKITSFRLVEGNEAIVSDATGQKRVSVAGARQELNPLQQIRLVTLIFNRLSLDGRHLSRTAALDLLKKELPQNVYMAVLVLGDSLQALQPFTNNSDLLRKAVERATSGAYTEFLSDSRRIQQELQQSIGPATAGEGTEEQVEGMSDGGGGSGAAGASNGPAAANQAMAQMMLSTLQLAQRSELAQTGRSAIWGLISAVEQQYRLPGRKSVLFFSEGFGVPQGMEEAFRTLISTANRFNVTFYSIDARGLNTSTLNGEAVSQLKDATAASRANFRKGNGQVTPAMANAFDTAINSGKANGQNTLAELAESTGGFLIANTNDFRDPLRKVSEDIETYYEVTYNPEIEKYDGAFRKVEVKTEKVRLRLQSRAGYFALPLSVGKSGTVLAPYELPLLQALESKPVPRDFGFQSSGFHFSGHDKEPVCEIVVDVPLGNLTLQPDKAQTRFEGGLAYVVLLKDSRGEVVRKFRGDVPLAATAEQVQALKDSHFIYNEHFDLPAGRYMLETAVLDRQGNKASGRKSIFSIPQQSRTLGMSSAVVVRSVRDKSENTSGEDPFLMAGKLVTPTLSPVEKKASTAALSFYVVIYPNPGGNEKPNLTMQFIRDGQALGNGSPPLTDPDKDGRIQYVATVPADKFDPGNYEVRFLVKQGSETAQESVTFRLE